jgi:hypothetical protein
LIFGMLSALSQACLQDPKPNIRTNKSARPTTSKRVTRSAERPSASPKRGPGKPSTNKVVEAKNPGVAGGQVPGQKKPRERNRDNVPLAPAKSDRPGSKKHPPDTELPPPAISRNKSMKTKARQNLMVAEKPRPHLWKERPRSIETGANFNSIPSFDYTGIIAIFLRR